MGVAIDDPAPCEICGKPAVTVVVNGREQRLCLDHLPADALLDLDDTNSDSPAS